MISARAISSPRGTSRSFGCGLFSLSGFPLTAPRPGRAVYQLARPGLPHYSRNDTAKGLPATRGVVVLLHASNMDTEKANDRAEESAKKSRSHDRNR